MLAAAPFTPSPIPLAQEQQYYYPFYSTDPHYSSTCYMPSSSSDSFASASGLQQGAKRVKLEQGQPQQQRQQHQQQQHQHQHQHQQQEQQHQQQQHIISYYPDSLEGYSNFSNSAPSLQQGHLQAPSISLHRPSEQPASPLTVATTISQYSTPSRSPSRVSILSENSSPDWVLFDESMGTLAQDPSKDRSSSFSFNQPSSNTSASNNLQPHLPTYPLQMDTSALPQYYAGFPIADLSKLTHHSFSNSYPHSYSSFQHTNEEDIPALSPSGRYPSSSHQSVCEGDICSPMTPIGSPASNDDGRAPKARTSTSQIHNPIPKLTRTVTDAVEDELFRSTMEPPKAQKGGNTQGNLIISPTLATYYQKAQKDHALEARNVSPSSFVTRDKSPFRANSPFHPMRTPQGVQTAPVRRNYLGSITAQGKREQQQELELQSISSQMMMSEAEGLASTPKTISPKDAVLEYQADDEASTMSLFAHEQGANDNGYGNGNGNGHVHSGVHSHFHGSEMANEDETEGAYTSSRRGSEAESISSIGAFSYHPSPQLSMMPANFPYPLQTLGSSEVGSQPKNENTSQSQPSSAITKPEGSKADTGAYTCTAPGCQQRFPTHAKLQKHRRESHRQSTPIGTAGMTSTLHGGVNRLQGPHRCTRINPTTGKPCNTVFSRPYDLTRHEDTIHNTTREKVRCEICNDEKTFSRQDALTRHKKVKHGIDK